MFLDVTRSGPSSSLIEIQDTRYVECRMVGDNSDCPQEAGGRELMMGEGNQQPPLC